MKVTDTGFDVGLGHRTSWHTREIAKVPFGSYQKVLEEYEEFLDARDQGLKLVMAFELSDMVGALAGCIDAVPEFRPLGWGNVSPDALRNAADLRSAVRHFEKVWRSGVKPGPSMSDAIEAADRLLTAILSEGMVRGFSSHDLLSQAQLRSAVTVNGRPSCSP